ncbi:TonB-dependent receptor [Maribellus maritimus]|uniref:TonB-dependent receptor n=1 Tax=Maribellus maritimus TaxID=2870838 RepID=UPI001EE9C9F7|nr:TonB-dependent receptor [Maribellus maritimus]MCG6191182.1 TonB-dependent receptor [Maribellus maritimus]
MKKILFLTFFSLGISFLYAQNEKSGFTVSGILKDWESGETLPFATVQVQNSNNGTITNADGYFTLFDVSSDTLQLVARCIGYNPQIFQLNSNLDIQQVTIYMIPSTTEIEAVIVKGDVSPMMDVAENMNQVSLSPAQISSLPGIGERDIFRALQLLPGISGTNEASSGLFVRGGTPDQNLVLLDGFTVYHVDHFYGFFSAFNADAIKDVQLYKGGFESKYGGRLSSVMELTGKTGNSKEISGGFGISAISANAFLEVPINEKLNFVIAGRRSYTDMIQSGFYNDVFDLYNHSSSSGQQEETDERPFLKRNRTEPSFYFYDLNAKLSYKPSDKDLVSLSFYNGKDNLDNSRKDENRFTGKDGNQTTLVTDITDELKWGNLGTSLRWARQWTPKYYFNLVISGSEYFSYRNRVSDISVSRPDTVRNSVLGSNEDNHLTDLTFRFNNKYQLNNAHTFEFGTQVTYNLIDYNYLINDTLDLIRMNKDGITAAVFLQDRWKIASKITLTGGLRYSFYDITNKSYYEPRLSGEYKFSEKLKVNLAWGHYYQFVNRIVREDVTQGSRDFWLLADDESNPVSFSQHYVAGLSYETAKMLFNIDLFQKDMEGLSEFSLRFNNPSSSAQNEQFFFEGTGVSRGMELLIQKKFGKLTGWVGYTLSEVVHTFPLISDTPFYALHDSRHEVNFVSTYKVGKWEFGGTWVYGTGKPYTAPDGKYQITTLDGHMYEFIHVGTKNGARLPDYHRLDLSAKYNLRLGNAEGSVGLSLFNVYNRENIWYKEYQFQEEEMVETDVALIGFTPNIFVNFKF